MEPMQDINKSISDEERQELLTHYQVTTQDLAFFKSQQWTLTNYAVIGLAAIAGVSQLDSIHLNPCTQLLLSAVALLVSLIAGWVLWKLHGSIEERRDRLERTYAKLSKVFREARGEKPRVSAVEMLLFLWFLLGAGFGISCWLIYQ